MGATGSRGIRVLLVGLGLAAVCALAGYGVYAVTAGSVKEWDVDAQGPVLVSADGRTLTLTGVPDPAWNPGECFGSLTVNVVTEEHAATVAVHFHLRSAPQESGGPAGSCARFTGIRADLAHPLDARTLADSHGRPLKAVSEASLPQPRDPGLTEHGSELCIAGQEPSPYDACLGSATLVRDYRDASQQLSWTLLQSLDPAAPDPAAPGTSAAQRTVLNGAPAVCGRSGQGGVVVGWTEAGTAQQLELDPRNGSGATVGQLCTRAIAEARTVR
ncbi:hypothetical protein [Kitasatospora sp. MAP5-34]|uniref:hypothetical protein n=1 Tax=Kitasatospora sp. MAP5-34 TaxID=3035102 RepID=UPI002473DAB6|nr:hypothetical protein [Kitasatospora sp. MAP5-34]MDH6580635.1 hypothetical protein [Kitasatospora sp. MAP5-34]